MDVNVLIHFMEHLVLAIIINERLVQGREPYHDLLLPRSWILYAVRDQYTVPMEKPEPSDVIARMGTLIARICRWDGSGDECYTLMRNPMHLTLISASDILYDGKASPKSWAYKYALLFRM
jgi:hypothetical protein